MTTYHMQSYDLPKGNRRQRRAAAHARRKQPTETVVLAPSPLFMSLMEKGGYNTPMVSANINPPKESLFGKLKSIFGKRGK